MSETISQTDYAQITVVRKPAEITIRVDRQSGIDWPLCSTLRLSHEEARVLIGALMIETWR